MSKVVTPLFNDWVQVEDRSSGTIYYANRRTQESSWVYPTPFESNQASDIHETASISSERDEEWTKSEDPPKLEAPEKVGLHTPKEGTEESMDELNIHPPSSDIEKQGPVTNKLKHWREVEAGSGGASGKSEGFSFFLFFLFFGFLAFCFFCDSVYNGFL